VVNWLAVEVGAEVCGGGSLRMNRPSKQQA
jgi:hypothetical protein